MSGLGKLRVLRKGPSVQYITHNYLLAFHSNYVSYTVSKVTLNSVKTTEQLLWFPMQVRYFSASYWKGSE